MPHPVCVIHGLDNVDHALLEEIKRGLIGIISKECEVPVENVLIFAPSNLMQRGQNEGVFCLIHWLHFIHNVGKDAFEWRINKYLRKKLPNMTIWVRAVA